MVPISIGTGGRKPAQIQAVDLAKLKDLKRAADTNRDGITTKDEFNTYANRQIWTHGPESLQRQAFANEIAFVQQNEDHLFMPDFSSAMMTGVWDPTGRLNQPRSLRKVFMNDASLDRMARVDGNAADLSRTDLRGRPIIEPWPVPTPPPSTREGRISLAKLEEFRDLADTNGDGQLSAREFAQAEQTLSRMTEDWRPIDAYKDVARFVRNNHRFMFDPNTSNTLISQRVAARLANIDGNGEELTDREVRQNRIGIQPTPLPQPIIPPIGVPQRADSVQVADIKNFRTRFDANRDGVLSKSELDRTATLLDRYRNQSSIRGLLTNLIGYDLFNMVDFLKQQSNKLFVSYENRSTDFKGVGLVEQNVIESQAALEGDASTLSASEAFRTSTVYGVHTSQLEALIDKADTDGNGQLSEAEFTQHYNAQVRNSAGLSMDEDSTLQFVQANKDRLFGRTTINLFQGGQGGPMPYYLNQLSKDGVRELARSIDDSLTVSQEEVDQMASGGMLIID